MPRPHSRRRHGLSLIELLVVLALIGVLLGLLMSAVQNVRGAAGRLSCQNNLKQVALATHNYHAAHEHLPAEYRGTRFPHRMASIPWTVSLLPHLEQNDLHQSAMAAYASAPGYQSPPHTGLIRVVKPYTCPNDGRLSSPLTGSDGTTAAYGSYVGVVGVAADPRRGGTPPIPPNRMGVIFPVIVGAVGPVRFADITDGLSQTVMFGERPPPGRRLAGNWYTVDVPGEYGETDDGLCRGLSLPAYSATDTNRCRGPFQLGPGRVENPCDSYHFWSLHPGGANFAFADGSVKFLRYSAAGILPALATRAGGETVPGEW